MSIIEVKNLNIGYQNQLLLKNINFNINAGDIFMILGSSGVGKTTLLRCMIGLEEAPQGEILIEGNNILKTYGRKRQQILNSFGVMYQSGALFSAMTLLENVRLPLETHTQLSPEAMNTIALQKLYLVDLADYAHYMPAEISGGMQKRAAIARAMALGPKVLFLDEPSAGLDPITALSLDQLIQKLSKLLNITFVIVSHELSSIFNIGKHVVILDKETQSVIAQGDPKELREHCQIPFVQQLLTRTVPSE